MFFNSVASILGTHRTCKQSQGGVFLFFFVPFSFFLPFSFVLNVVFFFSKSEQRRLTLITFTRAYTTTGRTLFDLSVAFRRNYTNRCEHELRVGLPLWHARRETSRGGYDDDETRGSAGERRAGSFQFFFFGVPPPRFARIWPSGKKKRRRVRWW